MFWTISFISTIIGAIIIFIIEKDTDNESKEDAFGTIFFALLIEGILTLVIGIGIGNCCIPKTTTEFVVYKRIEYQIVPFQEEEIHNRISTPSTLYYFRVKDDDGFVSTYKGQFDTLKTLEDNSRTPTLIIEVYHLRNPIKRFFFIVKDPTVYKFIVPKNSFYKYVHIQ